MATGTPLLLSARTAGPSRFQEYGVQGCPCWHNTLWVAQAAAGVACAAADPANDPWQFSVQPHGVHIVATDSIRLPL